MAMSCPAAAQIIITYAGTGPAGYTGDNGPATLATLDSPTSLALDPAGNLFISDQNNSSVRRIAPDGTITTIAGTGTEGYNGDGIPATTAQLRHNWGVATDKYGNVYITDQQNSRIRKISTSGIISTIGGDGTAGFGGDGGPATSAHIKVPIGIAVDTAGNVYFADANNFRVRKISPSGIISTVAGDGTYGYSGEGVPATTAKLSYIYGLATDIAGNLYIADGPNNRIRRVSTTGIINTIAGNGTTGSGGDGSAATSAQLNRPTGVYVTLSGEVLIADCANNRIRKIDASGIISTIAGDGSEGFSGDNGMATSAQLYRPISVVADSNGIIYISDMDNVRIRKIIPILSFVYGRSHDVSVCENATAFPLNDALAIVDYLPGAPDTISLLSGPAHGTAAISYHTTATGSPVVPTGLSYTPAPGYTGPDAIQVKVANGTNADSIVLHITVSATLVSAGTIVGDSNVCIGASIFLTDTAAGGVWSVAMGRAAATPLTGGVGIKGISAGTDTVKYTITNGCGSATSSKAITVRSIPNAGIITGPDAVCLGSSITLANMVPGGVWSTTNSSASITATGVLTGLAGGINLISYTISNNWCSGIATHVVQIDTFPSAGIITGPNVVCKGSFIDLLDDVPGLGLWSVSDTNVKVLSGMVAGIAAGTAIVSFTVTNSCGSATDTMTVTVADLPATPVVAEDKGILHTQAGYASYQWYLNGTTIADATDSVYITSESGSYSVAVANAEGCTATSAPYDLSTCNADDIVLYPNPSGGEVMIDWCRRLHARLMAADGRTVYIIANTNKIDLKGLPDGVYMLSLYDNKQNRITTRKVVKLAQ